MDISLVIFTILLLLGCCYLGFYLWALIKKQSPYKNPLKLFYKSPFIPQSQKESELETALHSATKKGMSLIMT